MIHLQTGRMGGDCERFLCEYPVPQINDRMGGVVWDHQPALSQNFFYTWTLKNAMNPDLNSS
jgi:hypothetical protein